MSGRFRITTAWVSQAGENPWLLSAFDESTEDSWGATPEFHAEAVEKALRQGDEVRTVDIFVNYEEIERLFQSTQIIGEVVR